MNPSYPFIYVGLFSGTLTNGSQTTISIPFSQNTVFELREMRAICSADTTSAIRQNSFSVQMQDSGIGQSFTSDFVPRLLLFGDMAYGLGGEMPIPLVFGGNSTLVFTVRNDTGSASLTSITITLHGIRSQKLS